MTDQPVRITCPRRMAEWGPWEKREGLDEYKPGHGVIGQERGCSFCGSMPPEDFLAAVRAGAEIDPTDKSYKLYVSAPNPEPDREVPLAGSKGVNGRPPDVGDIRYLSWDEMTEQQRGEAIALGFGDGDFAWVGFGKRPTRDGKFYTAHLNADQAWEFWTCWQDGQVRWGYPGYPYRPLHLPGVRERLEQQAQADGDQSESKAQQ